MIRIDGKALGLACVDIVLERNSTGCGRQPVIDHITAVFSPGKPAMITGATGAGKSTLLHLLAGLLRPTAGEVFADGQPIFRWSAGRRDGWRRQVGIAFQQLHLIPGRTVLENIAAPLIPRGMTWRQIINRARDQAERFDLRPFCDQPVEALSGGQRQRVAIARAMVGEPRYLLLDEPSAFQDDDHVRRLTALWRQAAEQGACIVVCSHDARLRGRPLFEDAYELSGGRLKGPG